MFLGFLKANSAASQSASRRLFLRRSAGVIGVAAAAKLIGGGSIARAATSPSKEIDQDFDDIRQHENDHVDFLVKALGKSARPEPTFKNLDMSSLEDFLAAAQAFENTGCGAYLGAVPYIKSNEYLGAAGSIALIEARHAGFINTYLGDRITMDTDGTGASNSFEDPLSPEEVGKDVAPFIKSLNGGPAVTYSVKTQSNANDIDILNFALALEYLERDFYNINVPKFFS